MDDTGIVTDQRMTGPEAAMANRLLIVESPTKARTLSRFLSGEYSVFSSKGHVKDLPKDSLGVDVEGDFTPTYVTIKGKGKILKELRSSAKKVDEVFLATDPDREGEAIAYHIAQEIGKSKKVRRVLFYEITEEGVRTALDEPQDLDLRKVDAQQARRILDRLVGYKISPILWRKLRSGLSAGRVQSVALRLICDRENKIESFVPEEQWLITARLKKESGEEFGAKLVRIGEAKAKIGNEAEAEKVVANLRGKSFVVARFETGTKKKTPLPPYTTSTLQQDASKRLRFSTKKTMLVAQQLYEGVELKEGSTGLITYMRTDSVRIASRAIEQARRYIGGEFGDDYLPRKAFVYKSRKGAQEAHEAIRPTSVERTPDMVEPFLSKDQSRLYRLIWTRFVACQMSPAIYSTRLAEVSADEYLFSATSLQLEFPGFLRVYEVEEEKGGELIPQLSPGEGLRLLKLMKEQKFSQPPPRFTEATLVKELEQKGIGRPSTYAPIVSLIQERGYVEKEKARLHPTELGRMVNKVLVANFPEVLNPKFTASMEDNLDKVETGEIVGKTLLKDFYGPFHKRLETFEERDVRKELEEKTEEICEVCGKPMVIKWGKYGRFLACTGYPECKNTRNLSEEKIEETCPKCDSPLVVKEGKYGRFISCSSYPKCDFTKSFTTGVKCPEKGCDGELVEKKTGKGKIFYGCSKYPKCKYALWNKPVATECPSCGFPLMVERYTKRGEKYLSCPNCKEKAKSP